jgi:hypothetical protein
VTCTPHDALVRAIFGQPQYAAEELRAVLPPGVLAEVDLGTLTSVDGSFVDEGLRASCADLLFSVDLRSGGSAFVYVLFEHQSTLDERMPLRLLRYQTRIWERFTAEHPDEPRVPPIVPLLLHQGPRPWPWRPTFSSVVALDERRRAAFDKTVVDFEFVLDDLARQTDARIMSRASDAIVRLTLLALRRRLARYAFEVGEAPRAVIRTAFADALVPENRSEVMVTAADEMRAEFRREFLLEQIEVKFGHVDPSIRARVEQAPDAEIIEWTHRILVVGKIEEVFGR